MSRFKLIPAITIENGYAYDDSDEKFKALENDPVRIACMYANNGADEIFIFEKSDSYENYMKNINIMIAISDSIDIPILVSGKIDNIDDVKRYLYTGAKKAVLDGRKQSNVEMINAASERFGSDKIAIMIDENFDFSKVKNLKYEGASLVIANNCAEKVIGNGIKVMALNGTNSFDDIVSFAENEKVYGVSHKDFNLEFDFMNFKQQLKEQGIKVAILESELPFDQFKLNSDGLIPVVVQDYKTDKVLMLAYMNEDSFNLTVKTGKMTYYSRSRNEIWVKGLTSGHFQYVKELRIDCDKDTILAKVRQVGVPCHTGAETCFFNELVSTDYEKDNPLKVFETVYKTIKDRKINPKEGSYTNYLFDRGIDKIIKKLGEEAIEILISAKNSETNEVKYEISDFMYHLMVLMIEKDVTWKDITKELSRR